MLTPPLTDTEVRVLGALVEKETTTPDNYPLSLSALVAACNQTSNREPVMRLDEDTVLASVTSVRRRGLARAIQPAGSRVTKYEHILGNAWNLDARDLALLGVLMLRGPQTVGELNTRTARLAEFADLADVERVLDALATREPEPLVMRLARRAGQKEARYAHLLSGEPTVTESPEPTRATPIAVDDDRVAALERELASLREELSALRSEFAEFRAQFG